MSMTQQGPGAFASSGEDTAAVTATGTDGADGVDASSDRGIGVRGTSDSSIGVLGESSSGIGVQGNGGTGVLGESSSGAGVKAESVNGVGVLATCDGGNAVDGASVRRTGVRGSSDSGIGVEGSSHHDVGVRGFSINSTGVFGESDNGIGVFGESHGGFAGQFDGNVQVNGNLTVTGTGTKAFVQAHPTDPDKEIVYVTLEGGEAGTYVRGSGQLESGKAVLALPEHFRLVTATEGLTVQLTPRGEWLQLYVVELDTAQLVVLEAQGKSGAFDYLIQGVRRGFEKHEVIRTKR